jgi:hypothetical protein
MQNFKIKMILIIKLNYRTKGSVTALNIFLFL